MKANLEQCAGCLLGGAVGDALGAPIEFLSTTQIRKHFGPRGVTKYVERADGKGCFTDDTQMTLFTAEALLRAQNRALQKGIGGALLAIAYQSYLRWLYTQNIELDASKRAQGWGVYDVKHGWLIRQQGLFARRAPGNTCLGALRGGKPGTVETPLNDRKGCGGIMRAAPVGLFFADDAARAFQIGCETAALTHGHPSGYLSAGCLASVLAYLVQDMTLRQAIDATIKILRGRPAHQECLAAIERALALHETTAPTPEAIETLGGAWVGEETLSIALYCALCCENDFRGGVLAAINHSGDSDSTGAVTGNVLGLVNGRSTIPQEWLDNLEMAEVVNQIATDLYLGIQGAPETSTEAWSEKYPPY